MHLSVYTHNIHREHRGESKYQKEVTRLKEINTHFNKVFLSLILTEQRLRVNQRGPFANYCLEVKLF